MGIRQWANKHKVVCYAVVSGCIAVGIGSVAATVLGNRHKIRTTVPQGYFSNDDGKTFFEAAGDSVPPFDYQGKQAVRAYVFDCGGQRFVGYLERYKPDAQKLELAGKATPATEIFGRELKRPGDPKWVSSGDKIGITKVVDIPAPKGMSGDVTPIEPNG